MKRFLKKSFLWAALYGLLLTGSAAYILLKTYVLPEAIAVTAVSSKESSDESSDSHTTTTMSDTTDSKATITDTSYQDENIQVTITSERVEDTTVYLADVKVSDPSYLKTALAENTYGRNIKETTSKIAEENQAILAINGDFYGFRDTGYVLRNGTLYRDTASEDADKQDLVIDENGDFSIIKEAETNAKTLAEDGAQQILSFGPALVENGKVVVGENEEVSQSMASNPRTAIAQLEENHYLLVVSEGRTDDSKGLSLSQLAEVLQDHGAQTAYNLDGGGSSTMYFNGKVVNQTVGGTGNTERSVSDILYIG